jgi:multidrug efflux pump subunit AcrA (membrane-fusion protein)
MRKVAIISFVFIVSACSQKYEVIEPVLSPITESIYASGILKSENQYVVYPKVSGIIEHVYVESGDEVIKGSPILSIYNENQRLNQENAALTAGFYDFNANVIKLSDLENQIAIAKLKMKNDSIQFDRQKKLKDENVGTAVDFDNSELAYNNSKTNYQSAISQYKEYKRQLEYNSAQAKRNLQISGNNQKDFTVFSEIDGKVYSINKNQGEMINPQTELAILGSSNTFVLEMQVDESDILKILKGQKVMVTLDSYAEQSFEAIITKVNPIMDERTKSFLIEAIFINSPEILYPNLNFEANIIVNTKEEALIIPREFVTDDTLVVLENGDTNKIKTGLKDFKMIEVLSGLEKGQKIRKPKE